MRCMKCGADIPDDQVFCDSCLDSMKQYPVRPNVLVQLPPPRSYSKKSSASKSEATPAQQIRKLKKRNLILRCMVLFLVLVLLGGSYFGWTYFRRFAKPATGQNYTVTGSK